MKNWINLLYSLLLYPVLPVLYFQLRNEVKPKKNIVLGVTLPYASLGSDEVAALSLEYKQSLLRAFWLLHVPFVLCLFAGKYMSILFGGMMLWLLLAMGVFYVLFVRYHQRFHTYKRSLALQTQPDAAPVQVDPEAIVKSAPCTKLVYYVPALLISLVPVVWELLRKPHAPDFAGALIGCLTMTFCILLLACTDYVLRRRSEAVSADSAVNTALTQARRGHWVRCSLWISYLTALFGIVLYLSVRAALPELVMLLSSVAYTFAVIIIAMRTDFACRHAQERLAGALPDAADTDRYWLLGMFYYNKQDKRNLVHSRTGTNSTFNMARPFGKLMMGFCALSILSIPVLAAYMIQQEITPIGVTVSEGTLHIDHAMAHKAVPLDEITELETLEQLPASSRINGTGLPTLLEGRFSMQGYAERCWFCLDPTQAPFITFVYDGVRYVLNASAVEGLLDQPAA